MGYKGETKYIDLLVKNADKKVIVFNPDDSDIKGLPFAEALKIKMKQIPKNSIFVIDDVDNFFK